MEIGKSLNVGNFLPLSQTEVVKILNNVRVKHAVKQPYEQVLEIIHGPHLITTKDEVMVFEIWNQIERNKIV